MSRQLDDTGAEPGWGLFVNEPRRDLAQRKSIKVKLPIRQHIKLHALKLFSENNISETVEAALDLYFDRMRQAELASRLAADDDGTGAVGTDDTGADSLGAMDPGAGAGVHVPTGGSPGTGPGPRNPGS